MITMRQIEAFHAVISIGSMTGAAKYLGRTQSAVSRLILELEQATGLTLFQRSGTRIRASEDAMLLYEEVRRSFIGLRSIEDKVREIARGVGRRRINVGATPALASGIVPRAIARMSDESTTTLTAMTSESVCHAVADGGIDLGLVTLPLEHENVHLHWIGEAPCVAVLSEHDPLAKESVISLKHLSNRQILTVANPFRLRGVVDVALKASGLSTHTKFETNTSLTAVLAARENLGIALVEPVTAYGIPVQGTVVRPLAEIIPWVWSVLTPVFRPLNTEVERLIESIGCLAEDLIPGFHRHPPEDLGKLQMRLFRAGAEDKALGTR
jgi:DNA-binding transcriptional LysR family regulator